ATREQATEALPEEEFTKEKLTSSST
ncbi:hypothetical protein A2U01_0107792, partial [Trifolium medium]|nr:hypothetical protein [Trifolium medium]